MDPMGIHIIHFHLSFGTPENGGRESHAPHAPRPPRQGTASRARVPFVSNPVRAEPAAALWRVGGAGSIMEIYPQN